MILYLDLIWFINFSFDLLLVLTVAFILKRHISIIRMIVSALIGSLSIFLLFISLSSLSLFFYKVIISFIMIFIAFGFKSIHYFLVNTITLYVTSMFLGGTLYSLNIQFSYKHNGIIFFFNGISINIVIVLILTPLLLYFYYKTYKFKKDKYNKYHYITINFLNNITIKTTGYLDTGNQLYDPYFHKPIILVEEELIPEDLLGNNILIPFDTINNHSLLECIKVESIFINGIGEKRDVYIGVIKEKLKLDGISCILHPKLFEGGVIWGYI